MRRIINIPIDQTGFDGEKSALRLRHLHVLHDRMCHYRGVAIVSISLMLVWISSSIEFDRAMIDKERFLVAMLSN